MMRRVTIQITNSCNLECKYCYQRNKGNSVISDETLRDIADHINEFETNYPNYNWPNDKLEKSNREDFILDFFGGEVLLYPKKILYFLHYFDSINHDRNYSIEISTNCTAINNSDTKELLKEYHNRISILPSLDGTETMHNKNRVYKNSNIGSFSEAKSGLDYIYKNYPETLNSVRITVAPNVVDDIYDGYKYLESQYPNLMVSVVPIELKTDDPEFMWNDENSKKYIEEFDKILSEMSRTEKTNYLENNNLYLDNRDNEINCVNGGIICFDVNGDIYPCFRFTDIASKKLKGIYKLGNVKDGISNDGFEKLKQLREHIHTDDKIYEKKCKYCYGKKLCATCPASALEWFGDTNVFSTLRCPIERQMINEIRRVRR